VLSQCARQRETAARSGVNTSEREGAAGAPCAVRLADWADAIGAAAINAININAGNLIVTFVLLK
jgi:hypothetical protein